MQQTYLVEIRKTWPSAVIKIRVEGLVNTQNNVISVSKKSNFGF